MNNSNKYRRFLMALALGCLYMMPQAANADITLRDEYEGVFYVTDEDLGLNYALYEDGTAAVDHASGEYYASYDFETLTIPEKVTYNGVDYTVTKLLDNALAYDYDLKKVTLPATLTTIGDYAFSYCTLLEEIEMPGVVSIGRYALCYSPLKELNIPASLQTLGELSLPKADKLERIVVDPLNPYYDSYGESNVLVEKATNTLLLGCSNSVIPSTVTSIGQYAFNYASMEEISIPDNITSIGAYAFNCCFNLKTVHMSANVKVIPEFCFYQNTELTTIELPEGLTTIGNYAFYYCSKLDNVSLPSTLTTIEKDAFGYCQSLSGIEIPEGVTRIEEATFAGCYALQKIILPSTVNYLGGSVFYYCSSYTLVLKSLTPPALESTSEYSYSYPFNYSSPSVIYYPAEGAANYQSTYPWYNFYTRVLPEVVDGMAYSLVESNMSAKLTMAPDFDYHGDIVVPQTIQVRDKTYSVLSIDSYAFQDADIRSISLPEGLLSLNYCAFFNCQNLTTITLPSSLIRVGDGAFYGTGLTSIVCLAENPPILLPGSFYEIPRNIPIHVPAGSETDYMEADYWEEFTNIIPTLFNADGTVDMELSLVGDEYHVGNITLDDATGFNSSIDFVADQVDYTRALSGSNEWGTLCLPIDLAADGVEGITFYALKEATDEVLTFQPVVGNIPAGKPVLFKRGEDTASLSISKSNVDVKSTSIKGSSADGLTLRGTFTGTQITDGYYLAQDGIYSAATYTADQGHGVTIKPFRAWFSGSIASGARQLSIDVDDEPTSLDAIPAIMEGEAQIFDLNGVPRESLQPGMNIVRYGNGRIAKVMVK